MLGEEIIHLKEGEQTDTNLISINLIAKYWKLPAAKVSKGALTQIFNIYYIFII